jgi:transcription antitermination factor NusG
MEECVVTADLGPAVSGEETAGWHVAHTRPRCEKKFAAMLGAAGVAHELPLAKSQRRYGARVRVSEKPLFPGYVFVRVADERMRRCYEQDLLVRLIRVTDEKTFMRQMEGIRRLLASGLEAQVRPLFAKGRVVRVIAGPLRGMSGVVENPDRMDGVLVFLDVLQQAVKVKIPAMDLRLE